MGRPRTGTLELRNGSWHTRITVGAGESKRRELYDLGTADEKLAKQKRAHLLKKVAKESSAGAAPPPREELKRELVKAETFEVFSARWVEKRKAQGIVSARDEENNLRRYVWPLIGDRPLVEDAVRSSQIDAVLEAAVAAGLGQETLRKIRAVMNRVYKSAIREDGSRIKTNPVTNTDVPKIKGVRKKARAIPTDEELALYFACPTVDAELQMIVLSARVEGGMRTGDVIRWDWVDVDTKTFSSCVVPRSKTDSPQTLSVPPVLAGRLRARWEAAGKPTSGPVFPVQRGPRKGEMRATRGISFAKRLRRDFKRAGVLRREIYVATERTLPMDFHSLRRAFVTRLATAGINVQTAMALAGHTDHRTHMLYVGGDPMFRQIPAEVVSFGSSTNTPVVTLQNQRATQDSNLRPSAPEAVDPPWFAHANRRTSSFKNAGMRDAAAAKNPQRNGTKGTVVLALDPAYWATLRWLRGTQGHLTAEASWWDAADRLLLAEGAPEA